MNQENENYKHTWNIAEELAKATMPALMNKGWDAYDVQTLNVFLSTLLRRDKSLCGLLLISSVLLIRYLEDEFIFKGIKGDRTLINLFLDVFTDVVEELLLEFDEDEEDETEEENTDDGE